MRKQFANHGTRSFFIAKYDADGKMVWVKSSGSDRASVVGKAIAIDKKGNCYTTGTFTSTTTFDTISITSKNLGYPDMFLAKYNSAGNIQWVRTSNGFGSKSPFAATVDAEGNPYIFGTFEDTATFGPITVTDAGTENIFLVKYNPSGKPQWARQVGRHGVIFGKALSIDKAGDVFMTGNFTDTAEFGKARIVATLNTQDMFFVKLSPRSMVKETKFADAPLPDFTFVSCKLGPKSRVATVKFSIPKSMFVLLEVDDMMGTVTESFIEGQRDGGVYEVKLNLKSFTVGGDYYCRLQAGKETQTKKMILSK